MHSLGKLREAARQVLAPVGAGAAVMTILGVTALLPGGVVVSTPSTRLAPSQSAMATSAMTAVAQSHSAPTTKSAAKAASSTTTPQNKAAKRGLLSHVLTDPRCASTPKTGATSGQAGVNCSYNAGTPALVVRVPVPNNPTQLHYVGLTSDKVDCRKLPNTPVARCVEQQQPSQPIGRTPR
jgi:hypothetical protein